MLCLYIDTLLIDYTFYSIYSILNELTLHKVLQNFMTNNVFGYKNNTTTTKQKSKHEHPCQSRESNPEHLSPQSDVYF